MILESLLQSVNTEAGIQGVGHSPRQYPPRVPVHNGDQIHETACHRNVGHVSRPDLVGPVNHLVTQQVRVDLVSLIGEAQVTLRILCDQIHGAHQSLDPFTIHHVSSILQPIPYAATAVERVPQVTAINKRHQLQLLIGDRLRNVVERRARQIQQLALASHRQRILPIYHFFPLGP